MVITREIGHLLSNKAQIQPTDSATLLGQYPNQPNLSNILTDKRNATIEFCHVRHVVHKHGLHEVTMTRTLIKALGLFELSGMLANIHEYFNCCH